MAKKRNSKAPKSPISRKKIIAWAAGIGVLVFALVLILCLQPRSEDFPQLEVAGYQITREEYLQTMYQARNDVLSDHAAAGISLKDWSQETPLGDPCQLITQRTLELLSEHYAVATLAVERGYLADASYQAMLQDRERINLQRQEALESGAIITGIPQFSLDDYISYRASNIRLQFCNDPDNPDAQVTHQDILQRYEADKDKLYRQQDSLELAFLVIYASPEDADALEQDLKDLRQLALEKGDLTAALESMPQLKDYYEEISVNSETYSLYDRSHSDILGYSAELQTGELSEVIRLDEWLCLIQCSQRIPHDYVPLEEVESVVAQSIRESRYDDIISARTEKIEISVDLQALYRFTAEQFLSP